MLYPEANGKLLTRGLEFSVAEHCNLRCAGCSHMSPFVPERDVSLASFARDLERLATALHASQIRLLGGEPLLNRDVVSFLEVARRSRIADRVIVSTNGLLLASAPDGFWESVDEVRVSLYPGASPPEKVLAGAAARARERGVALRVEHVGEFRTTMVTRPQSADWTNRMIFRTCGLALNCHTLRQGRFYKCPCPATLPDFLARTEGEAYDAAADGLDIHAARDLLAELRAYLDDDEPLDACRHCLGTVGARFAHRQMAPEVVAAPGLEPRTRRSHLSLRHFARATARWYWRRARSWVLPEEPVSHVPPGRAPRR